jgi:hypothetical protein
MKWPSDWLPAQQVDRFLGIPRDQQEMFMSLLPHWYGSIDELFDAVKSLND